MDQVQAGHESQAWVQELSSSLCHDLWNCYHAYDQSFQEVETKLLLGYGKWLGQQRLNKYSIK